MPEEKVEITLPEGTTKEQLLEALEKKTPSNSKPVIFKEFESGNNLIRIYRDVFKGREILAIRKFWKDDNENWQPGKGATFLYEDIEEIIEGLQEMKTWCEEHQEGGD